MSEAALIPSPGTVARPPIAVAPTPPASFINRIINADCLDVLPELPSRSIDFVFTDPPYLTRYCDRSGRVVAMMTKAPGSSQPSPKCIAC